jgi:hypothetical protein
MSSARSLALKYLRTSGGDQSHEKLQALFNKVSLHRMFMSELETRFKHGVAMKAPVPKDVNSFALTEHNQGATIKHN